MNNRASLEGSEVEIFKLVALCATHEQWKEWLRVPLEHAAARGNLDLFNKLLGAGADASAGWRGCEGRTLLDAAAVGGDEEVASALLLAGAKPDVNTVSCSSKRSALWTATVHGHEGVARRLVAAGANVHSRNPGGRRPVLVEATRGGHEQLVTDLLMGGADPNWRQGTLLHIAADKGFNGIVSTLLLKGAHKDAIDAAGRTPLIRASDRGYLSVVKTLLTAGADAMIRGMDNYSALDFAAKHGHVGILGAIAGYGADVNACDESGLAALHVAGQYNQADAVDALIKVGGDIDLKSNTEGTSLWLAAHRGSGNAVLTLLQHGAKVDARDEDGLTPLLVACQARYEGLDKVVDLLLRWGADETALAKNGQSPAELLNVEKEYQYDERPSTPDEIEGTRMLLARAPADRAWRRRCWLVMLRSRAEKARRIASSSYDNSGAAGAGVDDAGDRQERDKCKEARRDTEGRQGNGGDAPGAAGGDTSLGGVVALLMGLELEGVFRTVVGFL